MNVLGKWWFLSCSHCLPSWPSSERDVSGDHKEWSTVNECAPRAPGGRVRTSVDAREAKIQPNRRKVLTRIIYIPGGSRGYPSRYLENIRIPQGSFCSEAESRTEHIHPSLTHKHAWVLRWKTTKETMTCKIPLLHARGLPVFNAGYLPTSLVPLPRHLALRGDSHSHSPLPCRSLKVPWPCTHL